MTEKNVYGMYTLPFTGFLASLIAHNNIITNDKDISFKHKKNEIITIENYQRVKNGLRPSTFKILDIMQIELAKNNTYANIDNANNCVKMPIKSIMRLLCKKYCKTKFLNELYEDLNTLYAIVFNWEGKKSGGKKYKLNNARLCYCMPVVRDDNLIFTFNPIVAEVLITGFVMQYPAALLKTDNRNETVYIIGKFLCEMYFNNSNIKNKCFNFVSTEAICKRCNINIDTIRKSTARNISERIIGRINNALDVLVKSGVISDWKYVGKNKMVEVSCKEKMSYNDFIKLYVNFTV